MTPNKKRGMLVVVGKRTVEVFSSTDKKAVTFYAHTHCHCGTSMSSGEWLPTLNEAVAECCQSMDNHQAKYGHAVRS